VVVQKFGAHGNGNGSESERKGRKHPRTDGHRMRRSGNGGEWGVGRAQRREGRKVVEETQWRRGGRKRPRDACREGGRRAKGTYDGECRGSGRGEGGGVC
jgi:hypothetical protein